MYSTNKFLLNLYLSENCTQTEFAYRCDSNKHSINDWLNNKNELKFSKLIELCNNLGKQIKIEIYETITDKV